MMSRYLNWRGTLIRLIALAPLALALAAPLAVGMAPKAGAAPASCGAATSGCGPIVCTPITPKDYTLPETSPRGGARARLSRTSGVSGSTDTLTGSGWPAGATVELLLGSHQQGGGIWVNPTPFAQGVADASGRVTIAAFHTPQAADCTTKDGLSDGDNQTLFIAQTPDGKARISLLYTLIPAPWLESHASQMVTIGETILITGFRWEPGQKVTITPAFQFWPANGYLASGVSDFHQLPADAITVTAQRDGSITASVTIPQEPPETQIAFFATANGPRTGEVSVQLNTTFSILPSVSPILTLSRETVYAGGTVTVTGTNWPAGQEFLIAYCRGQVVFCQSYLSERLAFVYADANGRITATVQIPADARPGPITIQAGPLTSPFFDPRILTQTRPFAVLYPFAQAHPRIELALRALPYAIMALLIALIALVEWLGARRRGPGLAARL